MCWSQGICQPFFLTDLALTQVALQLTDCAHAVLVLMWSVVVVYRWMLLLRLIPTSADADPDLCTLCPDLCSLHPDLCSLHLTFASRACSISWCKHSTSHTSWPVTTCSGAAIIYIQLLFQLIFYLHMWWYHPLWLALVVLFPPATALAPTQLARVAYSYMQLAI